MSNDKEPLTKPNFFKKTTDSIGNFFSMIRKNSADFIDKIDEKTNPKIGNILYKTFRYLTIFSILVLLPINVIVIEIYSVGPNLYFNSAAATGISLGLLGLIILFSMLWFWFSKFNVE
ncbi:MAG: hypothetical protein GQ557_00645 [Mycoplasmataceae bacterium]|nr:hypothetical protein [Mycoplasmataceae bacterium]